jgi:hypothetical protein
MLDHDEGPGGADTASKQEKTAKSRREDQLSLPNQNCMRFFRYESNQKWRGEEEKL